MKKNVRFRTVIVTLLFCLSFIVVTNAMGQIVNASENAITLPNISIEPSDADNPQQTASALQLLFLISIITLVPSLLLMVTCFPRILIALHFLRSALGTQQMPPNQVMIALALFLTFFLMSGQISEINETALQPYTRGEISQETAIENGLVPIRLFMLEQVDQSDIDLFAMIADRPYSLKDFEEIPTSVLVPAFMISELKKGFLMGFFIYLPFIVIDMVVASTLMAMGMMMLPPAMISLPFKILFFILIDGWNFLIQQIFRSFLR